MQPSLSFQLYAPAAVEFGPGVAAKLGAAAAGLGIGHALLVTDPALADGPHVAGALQSLRDAGVTATRYADVVLDPDAASVERAAAAYRASGADGLVALGGGSAMDTAKALGVLAAAGAERIAPFYSGGSEPIRGIPPLICLPTTAGTGSEVTFVAIVTDGGRKMLLRDPRLAPALALVDPALTLSMPPRLTASTGLDALAHALEALTSSLASAPCDALALDALAHIARALPQAVAQGDDLVARSAMSLAAMEAGVAFVNARVHLGHAVGHSLGTAFKLPHGFACVACLPAILSFLLPAAAEPLARAATALGASSGDAVPGAVATLMEACGAPGLGALAGVGREDIPRLVELVEGEQRLIGLSPRRPSANDWATIFAESL
jgi:alcohol dehydrogenase class IV